MIISRGQKQANFLPVIVRRRRANGWIQIRQRIVFSAKSTWNGHWAWTLPLNSKSWNNGQSDTACMFTTWRSYTVQSKYNPNLFDIYFQGPRLTFLGRHQLVTKIIFFSSQMGKCGSQKVLIKYFLHSKTQKRKVFNDVSSRENIPTLEWL